MQQANQTLINKPHTTKRHFIFATISLFAPAWALAHPGHANDLTHNAFYMGVTHPFTGIDHLLAMLTTGLWVALTMTSRLQQASTLMAFLVAMLIGSVLSMQGTHLPAVEPFILLSLLVFGLLVATAVRLPSWIAFGITAFFALFHGFAHGNEMPAQAQAMGYIGGFLIGTLALLLAGTYAGQTLRPHASWAIRTGGALVAAYGVTLLGLA